MDKRRGVEEEAGVRLAFSGFGWLFSIPLNCGELNDFGVVPVLLVIVLVVRGERKGVENFRV